MTLVWLLAVPFVVVYLAVGLTMEALFGIRLSRTENSDGTEQADEVLSKDNYTG